MAHLHLVAVVVSEYDRAIDFFVNALGFELVEDVDVTYQRMVGAAVRFVSEPRLESYGKVAVFLDLEGNKWDVLGPAPSDQPQ